MSVLQTT